MTLAHSSSTSLKTRDRVGWCKGDLGDWHRWLRGINCGNQKPVAETCGLTKTRIPMKL